MQAFVIRVSFQSDSLYAGDPEARRCPQHLEDCYSLGVIRRSSKARASPTTAASALMANASQYEVSSQVSWKPLLDGMDAETVSVELEAYPKVVVAMDVITQSVIIIMTPHLPPEGSAPSKGKAPITARERKYP